MQFHANKTRKNGGKEKPRNKFTLQMKEKEEGESEDQGKSGEEMRRKMIEYEHRHNFLLVCSVKDRLNDTLNI